MSLNRPPIIVLKMMVTVLLTVLAMTSSAQPLGHPLRQDTARPASRVSSQPPMIRPPPGTSQHTLEAVP